MRLRGGSKQQELDDKMAEINPQEQSSSTASEHSFLPVNISVIATDCSHGSLISIPGSDIGKSEISGWDTDWQIISAYAEKMSVVWTMATITRRMKITICNFETIVPKFHKSPLI